VKLTTAPTKKSSADRTAIDEFLLAFLVRALPTAPTEQDRRIPFLELGANSLVLMEVQGAVESKFGIKVTMPQFFQELTSVDALAEYIEVNQAETVAAPLPPLSQANGKDKNRTNQIKNNRKEFHQ